MKQSIVPLNVTTSVVSNIRFRKQYPNFRVQRNKLGYISANILLLAINLVATRQIRNGDSKENVTRITITQLI